MANRFYIICYVTRRSFLEKFLKIFKLKLFWYYSFALLVVILFIVFSFYDLQISMSIANYNSQFGHFMETFGMIVAPILCMLAGIIGSVYCKKYAGIINRNAKIFFWRTCFFLGLICANIILLISDYSVNYIVIIFTLNPIMYFIASKCPLAKLRYLFKLAILTVFYVVSFLLIVQVLKLIWGRVRFYDLEDLAQFSPWYVIQGINGHKSFPSGHTANAMSIYILTSLNSIFKNKYFRIFNLTFIYVWILLMAYSRVLVGAHYCSDVLFSVVFGVFWFYFCKYFVAKHISLSRQKNIDKLTKDTPDTIKSTIITKDGEEI